MGASSKGPSGKRLKQALERALTAGQASDAAARGTADQLQQLAAERTQSAAALLGHLQLLQQHVDTVSETSERGQAAVQTAFTSASDANEQLLAQSAESAGQVSTAVSTAGDNRKKDLNYLQRELTHYLEITDQRREEVLKRLQQEQEVVGKCQSPAARTEEAVSAAGEHAAHLLGHAALENDTDARRLASMTNRRGCEALAQGRLETARRCFEDAGRLCPAAEPQFNLAVVHYLEQNLEASRQALADARTRGLGLTHIRFLAALLALADDDREAIRDAANQLRNQCPDSPTAHAVRATCQLVAEQTAAALQQLAAAALRPTFDTEAWGGLAMLLPSTKR